jgi:hypothetical protein
MISVVFMAISPVPQTRRGPSEGDRSALCGQGLADITAHG